MLSRQSDEFCFSICMGMQLIYSVLKPFTIEVFEADSLIRPGQCFEVSFLLHVIQTDAKKWQHHAKN
jgi:hypothetical protein